MAATDNDVKTRIANALNDSVLHDMVLREAENTARGFNDNVVKFVEAAGSTIDADEDQWRKLTGDSSRDLTSLTQSRMQKLALHLWESNLLANRLVELPIAYILAEGVTLQAADENVQEWIDKFWDDPINQMDIKLVKKIRELKLFGEQCWPTFVNEHNGHVRLGYLDPVLIETVVTDPDNGEQPIGIVTVKNKQGIARRFRVIVNGPEDIFTERTQRIRDTFADGDCFYFNKNALSNGKRGRSDLLAEIDWLDAYDHFLFGELDRADFLRAFIWDVKLTGATRDEVNQRATEITPPAPGSVRVHNENEEWTAQSPDIGAGDTNDVARLFRNHALGGQTLPEHWFGGGGDVNRSTGDSMGEPTFKIFAMDQKFFGYILKSVAQYQIRMRELVNSGSEPDLSDPIYNVDVIWPEMIARDTTKYAAALMQVTVAVAQAIANDLMTRVLGLRVIESIAGRLGVEFDAEDELEKVEAALQEVDDTPPEEVFEPTIDDDGDEDGE